MKESFIESLSPRTDVAYNLTNPRGRSSYTLTQQFTESGMTPEKLEKAILKAQKDNGDEAPVYAQRTVTIGGNSIAENSAAFMGETVVLKNAGTSLSSELAHGSGETPSLIFGGERIEGARDNSSKTASPTTLAAVAGLSAPKLVEKHGFTAVEAEKAAEVLRNITVPEGKTGLVTSEILPELKKALDNAKTSKGLKGELASRFGARHDVAYNLATTQGRAAYETTPSFASSGMSAGDLMRYANAIAERAPVSVRSGGASSALPTLSTPIYARSIASLGNADMARLHANASGRTVATAISPFGAPRVSVDEVVALGKAKSASAPQTGTAITEIPTQQNASGVSATPTASMIPSASAIPNTISGAMATSTPSARPTPRASGDPELERLRRIEANYEKDKAMLAREKAPALARSASHDVGHAEGSEAAPDLKKVAHKLGADIANELRSRKG
jgi:hypothetical protein